MMAGRFTYFWENSTGVRKENQQSSAEQLTELKKKNLENRDKLIEAKKVVKEFLGKLERRYGWITTELENNPNNEILQRNLKETNERIARYNGKLNRINEQLRIIELIVPLIDKKLSREPNFIFRA